MDFVSAVIISGFISAPMTYQKLHKFNEGAVEYKESIEFIGCIADDCPKPTVKTKRKKAAAVNIKNSRTQKTNRTVELTAHSGISKSAAPPVSKKDKTSVLYKEIKTTAIFFDFNKSVIKFSQIGKLNKIKKPESAFDLEITGYTDNIGTMSRNQILADERAAVIDRYLKTEKGFDIKQADIKSKALCCYAAANNTEKGRAKNRRTEVLIKIKKGGEKRF